MVLEEYLLTLVRKLYLHEMVHYPGAKSMNIFPSFLSVSARNFVGNTKVEANSLFLIF